MTHCKKCGKFRQWSNTGRFNKYGARINKCTNCGWEQAEEQPQGLKLPKTLLYIDIETSKLQVSTFNLYVPSKRLRWEEIKQHSFLLCWSAAWIPEDHSSIRIMSDCVTPGEALRRSDRRCLKRLWELMNRADYWCGHNIKGFDAKQVTYYFMMNGMKCPDLNIKYIDTLSVAKKYFRGDSNTLGYWLDRLGRDGKNDMKSSDWDECERGNPAALRKMQRYNKQDVRGGIEVLLDFKEFIESGGGRLYK